MMPVVSSMALLHFLWLDYQTEMQHQFFGHVMPLALASHDTNDIVNGTNASTGTSTSTKGHIIPLNNYVNIPNAMVSLMAPSALCY